MQKLYLALKNNAAGQSNKIWVFNNYYDTEQWIHRKYNYKVIIIQKTELHVLIY